MFHVKGISKFEYELRRLIHDLSGDLKADAEKVNFKYQYEGIKLIIRNIIFQILIKTQEYHFDLRYHRRYIEGIPEKSRLPVSQRPKKTTNQLFDEEDNLNYIGYNLYD